MADLAEFSCASFDPKAWVNHVCSVRPPDESLDKFLAELEMRLQLTAEEVEASLQDCSTQAMRRIPFAIQEIFRLQGDVQGMQDLVRTLLVQVGRDGAEASHAVATIKELDRVKRNMDGACNTLQEATELSGMFLKVEDVFASGDLPRVAQMLSSMRKSLSLVGDVPEFKAGKQKLLVLEDRLQTRVEGSLGDALAASRDEDVKALSSILLAVDRFSTIRQLFIRSRLPRLHAIWEELQAGGDITAWLPAFYSRVLATLQQERDWVAGVLAPYTTQLLLGLANEVFGKVSNGCKQRMRASSATASLLGLQQDAFLLVRGLRELLAGAGTGEVQALAKLVLEPLEEQVARYSQMEDNHVSAELAAVITFEPGSEEMEVAVKLLSAACRSTFNIMVSAVDRCLGYTGGTELKMLLKVVDANLVAFVAMVQSAVTALLQRFQSTQAVPGAGEGQADQGAALQLLKVCSDVSSTLSRLEALLRTTVATVTPKLLEAAEGSSAQGGLDLIALRLTIFPEKVQRLARLLDSVQEQRFLALPSSTAACDSCCASVQDAIFDMLMAPVAQAVQGFPQWPDWSKVSGPSVIPTFSAYPLPYITAIGEYLMTLPQLLEVLLSEEEEEGPDSEDLAAQWLDRLASAAAAAVQEQVMRLEGLSQEGAAQLVADVEYLCNVLAALHAAVPAGLLTVQLLAGQGGEEFVEAARAAKAEGGADEQVLELLAGLKGLSL